jgi:hypothetical protein
MKYVLRFALGITGLGLVVMFFHIARGEVHTDNHVNHALCYWAFIFIFAIFSILVVAIATPRRRTKTKGD